MKNKKMKNKKKNTLIYVYCYEKSSGKKKILLYKNLLKKPQNYANNLQYD